MFIIGLTYTKALAEVDRHLAAHRACVKQGFDDGLDGLFLPFGGQRLRRSRASCPRPRPRRIGALAATDPFVVEGVTTAKVIECAPRGRSAPRLP